jgi:FtsP/CotA-like multicopper oxidase with cupredoxin domain
MVQLVSTAMVRNKTKSLRYAKDCKAIVFTESPTVIGPLITGNKGDLFQLNLINNLDNTNMRQSTSIHWHGILQDGGELLQTYYI